MKTRKDRWLQAVHATRQSKELTARWYATLGSTISPPDVQCFITGCRNPVVSHVTMACIKHVNYRCWICKRKEILVRDHDHTCHPYDMCVECFRGFLCIRCNAGLGMFGDDPELLKRAVRYLSRPRLRIRIVPPRRSRDSV